ncbi:hypothetical protein PHMEG_0003030 [Phytophthora megakarya]|uniref:Uncharacterized protein n=1 Tax=Phytophthora megakarya TaxID=4795 RepID=A0A225WZ67_9STRA|nr:hypothetical protein PHMEG_0003030 [Phytophthora megakarya]
MKAFSSPKWNLVLYLKYGCWSDSQPNPIESHNRDIKRVVHIELYASIKVVMNISFPRIISHFGSTRDRDMHRHTPLPICPYAVGPIPIKCARKADILTKFEDVMIGGKAVNPSPVDADRAQMSINSRPGRLQPADGPAQIEKHYLFLHLVKVLNDEPFIHDWESATWSEKEIIDDFNLKWLLKALPAKITPGRP